MTASELLSIARTPAFGDESLRAAILSYGRSERERAAKVCDVTPPYPFPPSIEAAHAIRALPDEPAQQQENACRA